jgi:soluble lytic murein transglycosylase-like protein
MAILAIPIAIAALAAAEVQPRPVDLGRPSFADCIEPATHLRKAETLAVPSAERMKIRMHRLEDFVQGHEGGAAPGGGSADAKQSQALGATFDRAQGATAAEVDGSEDAPVRRPAIEGFWGSCALVPILSSEGATEQALGKLSSWQQSVAKKAIPIIDRLGENLGVYSQLKSMGVNEPRVFVLSLIQNESAFNPGAVSPKDARGLMQVLHGSTDLEANVRAGMAYLEYSLRTFGRPDYALASYNAGDGAVKSYLQKTGEIPPFEETRTYVKLIFRTYVNWVGSKWRAFSNSVLANLYPSK